MDRSKSLAPVTIPAETREVHLRDYWATIWRWHWTVITTFVLVSGLITIYTFLQTPIYRASTKLEIQARSRRLAPVADVSEMGISGYGFFAEDRYYNTQFEVIKSRAVAEKVFDRLDLWSDPRFKGMSDPVGAFARSVIVEPLEMTGIVVVSIENSDPERAAEWANTLGEVYVSRNLDMAKQATQDAVDMLFQQIDPLKNSLRRAQEETFAIAEKERLFVPEDQQKILLGTLTKLQQDLTETQIKVSQQESVNQKIEEVQSSGGSYLSISEIANDPILKELHSQQISLEQEIQKLLATFKEKHARVVEKEVELERLNQKIADEYNRIVGRLKTEYSLLTEHQRKTERQIEDVKTRSYELTQRSSGLELSRGDTAEVRKIYDLLSRQMQEIKLSIDLLNNNIRMLDRAEVPRAPVRPRKALNLLIGVLCGLFLGCGLAFFLEYLDNTVKTAEDVEQFLNLSVLSVIPKVNEDSSYAVRESLQTLRTSLLFSRKNRGQNLVLFTSSGPQEGKSTAVAYTARSMAVSGERVAVLDCDLRRPTMHTQLDLERQRGMTNYILASESASWRDYLKNSKVPNLYAMTSGPLPPNPPDIFGSDRFAKLLNEMKEDFDWVFIDSPPVASLTDSILLASMVDMVALVIRHNHTDKELVRRCVSNLRKVNPNVIGAVLNNVDLERSSYRDYYYAGYYYYGEGRSAGKKRGDKSLAKVLPAEKDSVVEEKIAH